MNDGIEVGIQLLLEDNVSDALAVIMKQLDAADQAIAATSANWEGLSFPDHVPQSPILDVPAPANAEEDVADIPDHAPVFAGVASAAPMLADAATVPVSIRPEQAEASPSASLPMAATYAPMPPDMPPVAYDSPTPPEPITAFPSSDYRASGMSDRHPAPPIAEYGGGPRFGMLPAAADGTTVSAAPIPPGDPLSDPSRAQRTSDSHRATELPPTYVPVPAAPTETWAPKVGDAGPAAPTGSDTTPTGATPVDFMATDPGADARSGEGQLMLDGSLLGRWIIEHLAHEADRPAAGGAAFDSRQGSPWSGNWHSG